MHAELRSVLTDLLSDHPSRAHLRTFVARAHTIAVAYLRTKGRRGQLDSAFFGLSLEDLALDAIAPLFQRDARGVFVVLRTYYERGDWMNSSTTSLDSATRRLVFGQVNEALFEMYGELDPALAKIIRNLKRWIGNSDDLRLTRVSGRLWVVHTAACHSEQTTLAPEEYIASHLISVVADESASEEIVNAIGALLSSGEAYRSAYPLTALARIVKSCYERLHDPVAYHVPRVGKQLTREETQQAVSESVVHTARRMHSTYVESQKLDADDYRLYFRAIRDRLMAEYVQLDGREYTNFKALRRYLPTLSKQEYRRTHRPKYEYLSKLTLQQLKETLKQLYHSDRVP